MRKYVIAISIFTALGIIIYWLLVFTGVFTVVDIIPGYRNWFMAFPLADTWIAICSICAGLFLFYNDEKAILFGLLTGSSLIFLSLNALLYGIITGLICVFSVDEIVEIIIKIYCFSTGTFFIVYFWNNKRQMFLQNVDIKLF